MPSHVLAPVAVCALDLQNKYPLIHRFYGSFLDEGNAAYFIREVAASYSVATLHRLASHVDRQTRRAAILALTMLGQADSTAVVGRALSDGDRGVRFIAEDGLPPMWRRVGSIPQRQRLQQVTRLASAGQFEDALKIAGELLESAPHFGDAWFARGTVVAQTGNHLEAISNCKRALGCEPYHYLAAMQVSASYLEIGDLANAIECLQRTLSMHPHWELARNQLLQLQRARREQTDC